MQANFCRTPGCKNFGVSPLDLPPVKQRWGQHAPYTPEKKKQVCLDAHDAPYECGQVFLRALAEIVKSGPLTCLIYDVDQYKRWVGVCSTPQIPDINAWMVRRGFAVAAAKYDNAYVDEEAAANAARAGLWAGEFMLPEEWRKAQKAKKN